MRDRMVCSTRVPGSFRTELSCLAATPWQSQRCSTHARSEVASARGTGAVWHKSLAPSPTCTVCVALAPPRQDLLVSAGVFCSSVPGCRSSAVPAPPEHISQSFSLRGGEAHARTICRPAARRTSRKACLSGRCRASAHLLRQPRRRRLCSAAHGAARSRRHASAVAYAHEAARSRAHRLHTLTSSTQAPWQSRPRWLRSIHDAHNWHTHTQAQG